ncbi:hypothetical protein ACQKWADRAFT_251409 [Trichoderma austrokoningii]
MGPSFVILPPRCLIRPSSPDSHPFPPSTPCTPAAGIAFIEWVAQPLCLVLLSIPAPASARKHAHPTLFSPHLILFGFFSLQSCSFSNHDLSIPSPPITRKAVEARLLLGLSVACPFAALAAASDTHTTRTIYVPAFDLLSFVPLIFLSIFFLLLRRTYINPRDPPPATERLIVLTFLLFSPSSRSLRQEGALNCCHPTSCIALLVSFSYSNFTVIWLPGICTRHSTSPVTLSPYPSPTGTAPFSPPAKQDLLGRSRLSLFACHCVTSP